MNMFQTSGNRFKPDDYEYKGDHTYEGRDEIRQDAFNNSGNVKKPVEETPIEDKPVIDPILPPTGDALGERTEKEKQDYNKTIFDQQRDRLGDVDMKDRQSQNQYKNLLEQEQLQNREANDWDALNKNMADQGASLDANARDRYASQNYANRLTNEAQSDLRNDYTDQYVSMLDRQAGRETDLLDEMYNRQKDLVQIDENERLEIQRQYDIAYEEGDIERMIALSDRYGNILSGENVSKQAWDIMADQALNNAERATLEVQALQDAGKYREAMEKEREAEYWNNTYQKALDNSNKGEDARKYKLEEYKKMDALDALTDPEMRELNDDTIGTLNKVFGDKTSTQYRDITQVLNAMGYQGSFNLQGLTSTRQIDAQEQQDIGALAFYLENNTDGRFNDDIDALMGKYNVGRTKTENDVLNENAKKEQEDVMGAEEAKFRLESAKLSAKRQWDSFSYKKGWKDRTVSAPEQSKRIDDWIKEYPEIAEKFDIALDTPFNVKKHNFEVFMNMKTGE